MSGLFIIIQGENDRMIIIFAVSVIDLSDGDMQTKMRNKILNFSHESQLKTPLIIQEPENCINVKKNSKKYTIQVQSGNNRQ